MRVTAEKNVAGHHRTYVTEDDVVEEERSRKDLAQCPVRAHVTAIVKTAEA